MEKSVPQPTECYYFEVLRNDQRDEVMLFLLNNFGKDEPLNRAANITSNEISVCLNSCLNRSLKNEISIIARSLKTNEIVGCMLNSVWRKSETNRESENEDDFEFKTTRREVKTIGEILNELHEQFWQLRPHIDNVIHFEISSVNINHRFKGLASKFMEFTENQNLLKSVSASGIVAEATSFGNQKLLEKRKYETLAAISLSSKIDETGKQILNCDDGTTEVRLVFKDFNNIKNEKV